MTVQVWRTAIGGTHVGNEADPAAWIPETMGFGTAAAVDTPSPVELNSPFHLAPGTYGIAVVAFGFSHAYTNGSNTFGGSNLSITAGSATNVPFTAPVFTPRLANIGLSHHTEGSPASNQRYQTILRRSQLLAGSITGLAFAACTTGRHWNDALLVRMSHVPANHVLSTTFAANLPAPLTVLDARDHSWHLVGEAWNEIGLQHAFQYDGASDLVVDIVARGNFHTQGTGFHRGDSLPRVVSVGWVGAAPATATGANSFSDLGGAAIRVQFGCANAAEYGWSCGDIRAGHSGEPVLGRPFAFTFTGAPRNQLTFLNLGLGNGSPPYPFSLTPFGLRNCDLFHEILATVSTFASASGSGAFTYNFPFTPGGIGFKFYGQWLAIDSSAPDGFAVSNYVRMLCGTL
jgi:hypothetical protein